VILLVCLVLCGCSRDADDSPVASLPDAGGVVTNEMPAEHAAPEPATPEPSAPAAVEPSVPDEPPIDLAAVKREIGTMLVAADFSGALRKIREVRIILGQRPEASSFKALSTRVLRMKRQAPELFYAVEQLGGDAVIADEIVRRKILSADRYLATLLLQKAVRDMPEKAPQAALLLGEMKVTSAAQLIERQYRRYEGDEMRIAVLDSLRHIPGAVSPAFLQGLTRDLRLDEELGQRPAADFLVDLFVGHATSSPEAYDGIVGLPGATFILRTYLRNSMSAGDEETRAWAMRRADDAGLQYQGLRGQYYAGTSFDRLLCERLDKHVRIPDLAYNLPGGRVTDLSVRWTGYLLVPESGDYTIFSASDDGQRVWIDGKKIIDDWTMHGVEERSATIALESGSHALRVEHMQGDGGGEITLRWQGPGIPRQTIPARYLTTPPWGGGVGKAASGATPIEALEGLLLSDSSPAMRRGAAAELALRTGELRRSFVRQLLARLRSDTELASLLEAGVLSAVYGTACGYRDAAFCTLLGQEDAADVLRAYVERSDQSEDADVRAWANAQLVLDVAGLHATYYHGTGFEKAVLERLDGIPSLPDDSHYPEELGRSENISIRWVGSLVISQAGTYTFYSTSDDGHRIWIGEQQVLDNWVDQAPTTHSFSKDLDVGAHTIRIEHMQGGGGAFYSLEWSTPDMARQTIPKSAFRTRPWPGMER
jgi:hypothetical protein